MRGYVHFDKKRYIEYADVRTWKNYLSKHIDRICKIFASIPDTCQCLLCERFSNTYKSRASLKNHIKGAHDWYNEVLEFWIKNYLNKTPDELYQEIHFYSNGEQKQFGSELIV